jgi:hypothetical protein
MDAQWWGYLSEDIRQTFSQACVFEVDRKIQSNGKDFRVLYDVSGCR